MLQRLPSLQLNSECLEVRQQKFEDTYLHYWPVTPKHKLCPSQFLIKIQSVLKKNKETSINLKVL